MQNIEVETPPKNLGSAYCPPPLSIGTILIVGPMMSKGKRKDYQVGLCASRLHYLQTVKFPSAGSDFRFIKRQAQSHTLVVATQTPISDDQRRVVQRGTSQSRENLWPYLYTSPGT